MNNEIKLLLLLNKCTNSIETENSLLDYIDTNNPRIIETYLDLMKNDLYLFNNSENNNINYTFNGKMVKDVVYFIKNNEVEIDSITQESIELMLFAHGNVACIADYADYKENIKFIEFYNKDILDNYYIKLLHENSINSLYGFKLKLTCKNIIDSSKQNKSNDKYNILADLKIKLDFLNRKKSYPNIIKLVENLSIFKQSLEKFSLLNPSRFFLNIKRQNSNMNNIFHYLYGNNPLFKCNKFKLSEENIQYLINDYNVSEKVFLRILSHVEKNKSLNELIYNIFIDKKNPSERIEDISSLKNCTFNYVKEYIENSGIEIKKMNDVFILDTIRNVLNDDKVKMLDFIHEKFNIDLHIDYHEKDLIVFFTKFNEDQTIAMDNLLIDTGNLTREVLKKIDEYASKDVSLINQHRQTIKNIINFTSSYEDQLFEYVKNLNKINACHCFEIKKILTFDAYNPFDINNIIEAGKLLSEVYNNINLVLGVMNYFIQNKVTYNHVATVKDDMCQNRINDFLIDFDLTLSYFNDIRFNMKSNQIYFKEHNIDGSILFNNKNFKELRKKYLIKKIIENSIDTHPEISKLIKEDFNNKSIYELMQMTFFSINPFNKVEKTVINGKYYQHIKKTNEEFHFKRNRKIMDKIAYNIQKELPFSVDNDFI